MSNDNLIAIIRELQAERKRQDDTIVVMLAGLRFIADHSAEAHIVTEAKRATNLAIERAPASIATTMAVKGQIFQEAVKQMGQDRIKRVGEALQKSGIFGR